MLCICEIGRHWKSVELTLCKLTFTRSDSVKVLRVQYSSLIAFHWLSFENVPRGTFHIVRIEMAYKNGKGWGSKSFNCISSVTKIKIFFA